jgi:hypothetical protein
LFVCLFVCFYLFIYLFIPPFIHVLFILFISTAGLIKTATKVLKKGRECCQAKGQCDSGKHIAQLDDLSDCAQQLSPAVDNLVTSLYAPVDNSAVSKNVSTVEPA